MFVLDLKVQADRILISDLQESTHFARYIYSENKLVVFADDTIPRWTTRAIMTDYNTIVGADKFGNFFVNRLPEKIANELDEDPSGNRLLFEKGTLYGAPYKVPDYTAD